MIQEPRVIPVLLMRNGGLVKSVRFRNHKYVGDPVNAVKIFNEKEVDELAIIDIEASVNQREPNYLKIEEIAGEAFMPISYGGGITRIDQAQRLFQVGVEKVIINKAFHSQPSLVPDIAAAFGRQSLIASIDFKKNFWGKYRVFTDNGRTDVGIDPVSFARECENRGAGEILLNSIDRDGTYQGYEIEVVHSVSSAVGIPVIICGGAGNLSDFRKASDKGASAVAAGSMFVFQRPHNAVLISYPSRKELLQVFN